MPNYSQPVTAGAHTRAFVIQFGKEADVVANRVEGRVEHVASGTTIQFRSLVELLAFFDQLLKEHAPPVVQPTSSDKL